MISTQETEINGHVYSVTQLPARRALRLQYKLMKIFAPSLPMLLDFGNGDLGKKTIGITTDKLSDAFLEIFTQMDERTYESMIFEMLQGVRRDGVEMTPNTVDIDFMGDLMSLMKVLWFVLGVNFDSFFGANGIGILSVTPKA